MVYTEKEILTYIQDHRVCLQRCTVDGKIDMDSVRKEMTQHDKEVAIAKYLHKISKLNGKDKSVLLYGFIWRIP